MVENNSSYKQIMKATSIFGGVQVFTILIGLVRSKFVAVLLGTTGFGINGLLNTPLILIGNLTGLGIGFSAVRDISLASESGNTENLSISYVVLKRWAWITGIFGLLLTAFLSPQLSQWSFGNSDYTWSFIILSITLFFGAISGGQMALLRGTRRIKETAKSGIIGSFFGLISSIPLYYYYGMNGIVPALIASSIITLLLSWWFSRRIEVNPINLSYRETYFAGKKMAYLGIMITLSGLVMQLVTSLVNIFIRKFGTIEDVGLYSAGWSITNQYVGLVFTAMAVDYFPRLAGLSHDNEKMSRAVNQQAEIAILILGPIMILYLTSLPFLIKILFTPAFLPIIYFAKWVVIGMLFKSLSWAMAFIMLAKGNSKLFLITETLASFLTLVANIVCYYIWGLEGMGISFAIIYLAYVFFIWWIVKRFYQFTISRDLVRIFGVLQLLILLAFLISFFWGYPVAYFSGAIILIIASIFSLWEINKRIEIKNSLRRWKSR